jgi:hypothetical protein
MEPNQLKQLLIKAFQAKGVALGVHHILVEGPEFTIRFTEEGAVLVPMLAVRGEVGASHAMFGMVMPMGPQVLVTMRLDRVEGGVVVGGDNTQAKAELVVPWMVTLLGKLGF